MFKESLEKARELISQVLCIEKDINLIDKVELMMNIDKFLNPNEYQEIILILNHNKRKVKKNGRH